MREDLSEDLEELGFLDLSVSALVNSLNELVDLGLRWLLSSQLLGSSADEVVSLISIKRVASILVELSEDGIDGISELLIGISHFDFQLIINISSELSHLFQSQVLELNYDYIIVRRNN